MRLKQGQGLPVAQRQIIGFRKNLPLNDSELNVDLNSAQQANKTKGYWAGCDWSCQRCESGKPWCPPASEAVATMALQLQNPGAMVTAGGMGNGMGVWWCSVSATLTLEDLSFIPTPRYFYIESVLDTCTLPGAGQLMHTGETQLLPAGA